MGQIQDVEANIAEWQALAEKLPEGERKAGILRGIQQDEATLEYLKATAPDPVEVVKEQMRATAEAQRVNLQAAGELIAAGEITRDELVQATAILVPEDAEDDRKD